MKERRALQPVVVRCKLVLVGDVQCGKTAMLQVLAKDCYPEVSHPLARGLFPPARKSRLSSPSPPPPAGRPTLPACLLAGGLPCLASPET